MKNKATSGYKRQHGLTIQQQNAIDLLVQGKTDQDTADTVGVNRVTITKWRNYDPWFQAELNRRRKDVWGSSVDRLRGLLPKALERIEAELEGENGWRVAMRLIELAGLSSGRGQNYGSLGIGLDDPEAIIDNEVRRRRPSQEQLLAELVDGGPVTDADRQAVLDEFDRHLEAE